MSSRFVEFTRENKAVVVNAETVRYVARYDATTSEVTFDAHDNAILVDGNVAEVVAKLQGFAFGEQIELLERFAAWGEGDVPASFAEVLADTRALLAKLKGGKL